MVRVAHSRPWAELTSSGLFTTYTQEFEVREREQKRKKKSVLVRERDGYGLFSTNKYGNGTGTGEIWKHGTGTERELNHIEKLVRERVTLKS